MRGERIDDLREQALAAAEGLSEGEHALVEVLREIEREKERAADGYRAVVRSLAAAIEARDGYTGGHSDEVQRLSTAVALRLGFDRAAIDEIRTVALLHDVGKIGIPDHVLHNPDPLSREEWAVMRQHPVIGERILEPLPGLSEVARAVRHEHERWDGTGYPDGLSGEDIPLAARVVLACDAYHALVSDRPYRRALPRDEALRELEFCSGTQFDPAVIEALVACVLDPSALDGALADGDDEGFTVEPESRLELELRALITVAGAVAAAHGIEDVIETAAEEARRALAAGSLSISKFEDDAQLLRTLINVGTLAEGEERFPSDEVYSLDDYPRALQMLSRGEAHLSAVDDPTTDHTERDLLRSLGKVSAVAVPIVFAGGMWGELYATRETGDEAFTERDVRFLRTISGQVGAAIGRAELFTGMTELAFKDSLTGLANRRALDERLEAAVNAAVRDGHDLSLVLCDMDNLKQINDTDGHQAGDDALVRVADALRAAAQSRDPDAMVGRIGGDEFCILLPGMDAPSARTLTEQAMDALGSVTPRLTLSCGIASVGGGARRPADLVRAADAAQYTAKRTGRRRVYIAQPQILGGAPLGSSAAEGPAQARRRLRDRDSLDLHRLLEDTLGRLDTPALRAATPLERLSVVVSTVGEALDSTAWTVSYAERAAGTLRTMLVVEGRDQRGLHFDVEGESYDVDAYPETRRILDAGGAFVVSAEDEEADPAERRLLEEWSLTAVLAAAAPAGEGAWLAELYADDRTRDFHTAAPYVRLLVAEAVRGAAADSHVARRALRLA
ncbi:MAG TPA: HD domain-containing phosphohydrolase [Thermoleophilaceae bacterium]|nr:HD domain-containing phosphohydrolase [Thermoleophilaceae bacterium]